MSVGMSKEIRINVRTTEEIKEGLEIAAKLRGLTVSSLVNSLVVAVIREEKEREPQAFLDLKQKREENLENLENPETLKNGEVIKTLSHKAALQMSELLRQRAEGNQKPNHKNKKAG